MQETRSLSQVRPSGMRAARAASGRSFVVGRRIAHVLSDAVLVWLAFWIAYLLRYRLELGGHILPADQEPFATFHDKAALFVGLALMMLLVRGVYRLPRWTGFLDEAMIVANGLTTAMAGVIFSAFLLRFAPSRLVFLYAWACAIVLLLSKRVLSRRAQHWLWSRGIGVERVLVVGTGQAGRRVMQAIVGRPALGYRLVGFVDEGGDGDDVGVATEHRVTRSARLGTPDDVGEVVERWQIDEVIIALPAAAHDRVLRIVDQCRARAVTFKVVPDLMQLALDRVDLGEVAGVPLIGIKDASISGGNYWVKRAMDICVAVSVLMVMALPTAVIALLIRRDSHGPVLYRQRRIGRNGVPFTFFKFRCMVADADERRDDLIAMSGSTDRRLFKLQNDPRLTRIGRVLRRWSLDELPQFVHVLRGQMSVVGPRPPLPEEVEDYEGWHHQRFLLTPGLTGLWQVNGRSHLTFDEMVRLDLYYAEHWSPWLDIKIVLRTIPAVLTGRGAY